MGKNTIDLHNPELAMVERLRILERNLRDFKTQVQAPKIHTTLASTVTFGISSAWAFGGGTTQPDKIITSTLTSPTGKRLLAIPEFSMEWGAYGAPLEVEDEANFILNGDDRHFPEGNKFINYAALPQWYKDVVPDNGFGISQLDLNWWYEWLTTFVADGDLVATMRLRIDGAMQNAVFPAQADWDGHAWTFYGWWRYMNVEATT